MKAHASSNFTLEEFKTVVVKDYPDIQAASHRFMHRCFQIKQDKSAKNPVQISKKRSSSLLSDVVEELTPYFLGRNMTFINLSLLLGTQYPSVGVKSYSNIYRRLLAKRLEFKKRAGLETKASDTKKTFSRVRIQETEAKLLLRLSSATEISETNLISYLIRNFAFEILKGRIDVPETIGIAVKLTDQQLEYAMKILDKINLSADPRIMAANEIRKRRYKTKSLSV